MVPEEAPMIVFDGKSAMCIANNGNDTKQTIKISRDMHFVRNVEKCKMHYNDWCEGSLQLADIDTINDGERVLTPKMKYIIVILDN